MGLFSGERFIGGAYYGGNFAFQNNLDNNTNSLKQLKAATSNSP